jgi:hypothetical protein
MVLIFLKLGFGGKNIFKKDTIQKEYTYNDLPDKYKVKALTKEEIIFFENGGVF